MDFQIISLYGWTDNSYQSILTRSTCKRLQLPLGETADSVKFQKRSPEDWSCDFSEASVSTRGKTVERRYMILSATVVVKWATQDTVIRKTRKGERQCWWLLLLSNRGAHGCITADRYAHKWLKCEGPSWHWMYKRGKQYLCNIWWQPLDSCAWKEKSSVIKKYWVFTISHCKERLNQNSKKGEALYWWMDFDGFNREIWWPV